MLRQCPICGEMKSVNQFYPQGSYVHHCRACQRVKNDKWRKERQDFANEIKAAGCMDCGYVNVEFPQVFDFDHRPDEDKLAPVSALLTKGTFEAFRAEIAKCDVVCSNCHRIRTARRIAEGGAKWPVQSQSSLKLF